jgi:hypothetical protein
MMNPYIAMAIIAGIPLLAITPLLISDWRTRNRRH